MGSGLRTGWLILGILLLLIVLSEAGLRLALTARDWLLDRPLTEHQVAEDKIDRWARADAYRSAAWVRDYYRELQAARPFVWHPYIYWRRPPYQGRYIRVDRKGRRATWNPPLRAPAAGPPPVRLFTFGASTMWGSGARDDHTIASSLGRLLYARGYRVRVTNYGESAYVSTQSAIALLRAIHQGERPDIALFYNGDNDVITSTVYGVAGIPYEQENRRAEFALCDRPRGLLESVGRQLPVEYLWGIGRLAAKLRSGFRPP
ncbi:MAG: hypothetical protein LGR52_05070, partial [Candidatus Thiosymbion ectosymbiont of Robbea hypermnestra]|nr:hypothetical protein [Candidatus Thiosymbion ectosymbiont of Robbea hypermnestra]